MSISQLFRFRDVVAENIDNIIDSVQKKNVIQETKSDEIIEKMHEFLTRGKMFRSCLFLSVCNKLGMDENEDIYRVASALELMQASLLIFDDIMDEDELRRGLPAFHISMRRIQNQEYGDHDAQSIASCVGIALIMLAYEQVHTSFARFPLESVTALAREFDICYFSVAFGQILDIRATHAFSTIGIHEVEKLHRYKTAEYTLALPLVLAGICAGLSPQENQILREFGHAAGLLYQLQDDVLDFCGEEAVLGKPLASDLFQGKPNLVAVLHKELYGISEWQAVQLAIQRGETTTQAMYTDRIAQEIQKISQQLCSLADAQVALLTQAHSELSDLLLVILEWIQMRKA